MVCGSKIKRVTHEQQKDICASPVDYIRECSLTVGWDAFVFKD